MMSNISRLFFLVSFVALTALYGAATLAGAFSGLSLVLPWWAAVPLLGWLLHQRSWFLVGVATFVGAYAGFDMHLLLAMLASGMAMAFAGFIVPIVLIFLTPKPKSTLVPVLSSEAR